MVSPELLRRFPFFGFLDPTQLKAVAMVAEEVSFRAGEVLFETGAPAEAMYLLIEGCVELHYTVIEGNTGKQVKEFFISEFNLGDIFGISALIEPYQYTATAKASCPTQVIRLEGASLRALCEVDARLAYGLMRQAARTAMERLHDTRIQLVAARA